MEKRQCVSSLNANLLIRPFDDGFLMGYLNRAGRAFDVEPIPCLFEVSTPVLTVNPQAGFKMAVLTLRKL